VDYQVWFKQFFEKAETFNSGNYVEWLNGNYLEAANAWKSKTYWENTRTKASLWKIHKNTWLWANLRRRNWFWINC